MGSVDRIAGRLGTTTVGGVCEELVSRNRKKRVVPMPRVDAYARARAAFSVAHMSNAKWRKVLRAFAAADLQLTRSEWKRIDSDQVTVHGIPGETDIMEQRFADGQFLPTEYKWFEWVRFPQEKLVPFLKERFVHSRLYDDMRLRKLDRYLDVVRPKSCASSNRSLNLTGAAFRFRAACSRGSGPGKLACAFGGFTRGHFATQRSQDRAGR